MEYWIGSLLLSSFFCHLRFWFLGYIIAKSRTQWSVSELVFCQFELFATEIKLVVYESESDKGDVGKIQLNSTNHIVEQKVLEPRRGYE